MLTLGKDIDTAWVKHDFGDGEEKYQIRYYSPAKIQELKNKHTKDDEVDLMSWQEEAIDYILIDWDGILLPGGKKASCNKKNKVFLMNTSKKRTEWLLWNAQISANFEVGIEEILKNLNRPSLTKSNGAAHKDNILTAENA